ncbi:hypothetical protein N24_2314 [Corynebacterium suranareeae]|uniref:DUF1707 domain-containing protein n=1 Tax=Corynebacterium suranareeae TaxID=2506452 RepID=A0A160PS86_9CORY|nr:DUF1707 domain-containing protein [Corynebacterium suranareeae]BAU96576.1 hypothetical protein N24_2314 [Corynebacterium suranareeae]
MNVSSNKPSDSDREYLQSELTRLVGQGRLDLDTYQNVVDTVWSTDDLGELMRIRARYLGGPQLPPQTPPQHYGQPSYGQSGVGYQNLPQQQPGYYPTPHETHMQQPPMHQPPTRPQQYQPGPQGGIPVGGHLPQNGPEYSPEPETSTMGSIQKSGEWLVPAYSAYKLNGADLFLDIRHATAAAPIITFDVNMTMASMTLIVPPGVHVEVQMSSKNWSDFKVQTSNPIPGAPRVIITGVSRASGLKVLTKHPNEPFGFWQKMFE